MTIPPLPENESLRNILPVKYCESAIPVRITKLKEERASLISRLTAINSELTTLETLSQLLPNAQDS